MTTPFRTNPQLHRRFFWRVRERFGGNWWALDGRQVAREMRMMSNRRTL